MNERFDFAVIGGGIAGLAVAEIFARSGRGVLLLERNARLCQEASASQHGWFHMGSLYSIFLNNRFLRTMVGGVEDLRDYYSEFPDMNIRIDAGGRLCFEPRATGWFRDEPIEYIVAARNDPDFDLASFNGLRDYVKKLFFLMTWEMAIKQFISRHRRFHRHDWNGPVPASRWIPRAGFADYSREVITKPRFDDVDLDPDTHFRIVGYDRPMRAWAIVRDLVRSLIGSGGVIETGAEVERVERGGRGARLVLADGRAVEAVRVIAAAGRWIARFVPSAVGVRVVASPLLVAYPAVAGQNFVRMTPFVERTVNHLHHEVGGRRYSVIGGGYYADPDDRDALHRVQHQLSAMAHKVFPRLRQAEIKEIYMGYKTELVPDRGERNYQYFIREIGNNLYAVVPGKFSLAFSLAVNTYKRLTGKEPARSVRLATDRQAAEFVDLERHARVVARGVERGTPTAPSTGSCARAGESVLDRVPDPFR